MSTLERLVASAREAVERRIAELPLVELSRDLGEREGERPFREALVRPGVSLVAEFKRRSPSAGELRPGADVAEIVRAYEQGGAAALSVLTEEAHFGGSLADLRAARDASSLPILRKDITVHSYQLYEAAINGADAVLLIAGALDDAELTALHGEALALDLDCVVEVHDSEELKRAIEIDADVIGINNRNLKDLTVDLDVTFELMSEVPAGKAVISESGISHPEQLEELARIGVDAVLVGEVLMRAEDPEAMARALAGDADATREHKIQ